MATKKKTKVRSIKTKADKVLTKDPTKTKGVLEGQKAPPMELPLDHMNEKERAVLRVFNPTGPRGYYNIANLAQWAFPVVNQNDAPKANSWVRNSLRRLVRGGWIEHPSKKHRGVFRLSVKARKALVGSADQAQAASA